MSPENLIGRLRNDLAKGLVVTVTGTGVSIAASRNQIIEGFPVATWKGLLQLGVKHCKDIGAEDNHGVELLNSQLESGTVNSLIAVAEHVTRRLNDRSPGTYRSWLKYSVGALRPSDKEIIEILDRIPGVIATLNYDDLFEQVTKRRSVTWRDSEETQDLLREENPHAVLHLHGWWKEPDSVVLGFGSYETVKQDAHTQAVLRLLTIRNTLLFVGCSGTFADPNFSSLVDWAQSALQNVSPRHFLLCRAGEIAHLRQELRTAPWLQLLPYGEEHSDLGPFLKNLVEGITIVGSGAAGGIEMAFQAPQQSSFAIATELLAEVGASQNEKLDAVRQRIREGNEGSAEQELRAMKAAGSWAYLPAPVKSRTLRTLAILVLNRRCDAKEAEALIAEAKSIDPNGSYFIADSLLTQAVHGPEAALALPQEPSDRDEWHTHAVLLLNANKLLEALAILERPPFDPDAETDRLRALAYLLANDISKARKFAELALSRAGEQIQIRRTSAIVDYRSALSPGFENWTNWHWPFPPSWRCVRRDSQSREALHRSAAIFSEISSHDAPHTTPWLEAKTWQLAAIANIPSLHSDATAIAQEILSGDPSWIPAIAWTLQRDLPIPLAPSRQALEVDCISSPKLETIQALFSLLVADGEHLGARLLVERHKALFVEANLLDLWYALQVQALLNDGRLEAAEHLLSNCIDNSDLVDARGAILRYRGDQQGWTKSLAALLAMEFERTDSDTSLFDACIAHHRASCSDFVVKHSDELMRRFGTEPALRLVLEAVAATAEYKLCLRLMEQHRAVFANGDFPPEVLRLRGVCLRKLGRLLEAEQEFRLLVRNGAGLEDQFALFSLQLDIGQVAEASVTAKNILHSPNTTQTLLLHVAGKLRPNNPGLAKLAFSHALKLGLETPQEAALAMDVGFPLGEDDKLSGVVKKALVSVDDQNSPLVGLTLSELIDHQREWQKKRSDLEQDYRNGKVAIHPYSLRSRETLTSCIHISPLEIENSDENLAATWSFRARHASNRKPKALSTTTQHGLFLDITSLLLIAHLDILEAIHEQFSVVEISPWMLASLGDQLEQITSCQPSRIPPKEEVVTLAANGKIDLLDCRKLPASNEPTVTVSLGEEWAKLFSHAKSNGAILVDHFPLTSNDIQMDTVALDSNEMRHVRCMGDVLEALERAGELTTTQVDLADKRLGNEGLIRTSPLDLDSITFVLLETGLAEALANAGLLSSLAANARVLIRAEELERLRLELAGARRIEEHADWLRSLREQIVDGLDSGRFVATPHPGVPNRAMEEHDNATLRCLFDLLDESRNSNTLTCCDDRAINRFREIGKSPLVSLFDILWFLHQKKKLSNQDLFRCLHRLRAGNIRYIPASSKEILFHLERAQIASGELIETAELAVLRRYFAACALDAKSFQVVPPGDPKQAQFAEALFLATLHAETCEAVTKLWIDKRFSNEQRRACSDWILDALWFDVSATSAFAGNHQTLSAPELRGMSEAHLALQTLSMQNRASDYLTWLFSRFGEDPHRLTDLAAYLKPRIIEMSRSARNGKERAAAQRITSGFVQQLPSSVCDALKLSAAELKEVGLKRFTPVNLGNVVFDSKTLWPAAKLAEKRGSAKVMADQPPRTEFVVTLGENKRGSLAFASLDGTTRFQVTIPGITDLLRDDAQERYRAILKLRGTLDRTSTEAEEDGLKIGRSKRVDLRITALLELLDASVTRQFHDLQKQIRKENIIRLINAEPKGVGPLLKHLRLPSLVLDETLPTLWDRASSLLVEEEGFEEAFIRGATLPLQLPEALHESFANLQADRRKTFIQHLDQQGISPLVKFHGAFLLLRGSPIEQGKAISLLSDLRQPEQDEQWELFQAILAWTVSKLRLRQKRGSISEVSLLAATWIHSSRLHQLLSVGDKPQDLIQLFRNNTNPLGARAFDRIESSSHDVSEPGSFNSTRFLVSGISSWVAGNMLNDDSRLCLQRLLEGACFSTVTASLPALPLLRQRLDVANVLGSFLADVHLPCDLTKNSTSDFHLLTTSSVEAEISKHLESINQVPSNAEAWVCLAAYLSSDRVPKRFHEAIRSILVNLDFVLFADPTFEQLQLIAGFGFRQMSSFPKDLDGIWLPKLHQLAGLLQDPLPNFPKKEGTLLLGNCILWLCQSSDEATVSARRFADTIGKVCSYHPVHASGLLRSASRIALQQPTSHHATMWRGITELRAAASSLLKNPGFSIPGRSLCRSIPRS